MEREEIQLLAISFSIVILTLLFGLVLLFFFFQKKKSKFLLDKMERDLAFNAELTQTKIEIKEQTLTNVSKELHDNVGQILSVALMHLNIIIEDEQNAKKNELSNIKDLVTKSLNEIRVLSKIMNGDLYVTTSFIDAISEDLDRIGELKKIKCNLTIEGKTQKLNKEHETIIYRILQESVSNILKHSHSDTITIEVVFETSRCLIKIIDTGKGFDINNCKKGSGLTNIMARTKLLGAKFDINSTSSGTVLIIDYPIKDGENGTN